MKNLYHICKIQSQKKKSGVKKMSGNFAFKGGGPGVGPLMANAILNFHFAFFCRTLLSCLEAEISVKIDFT